MEKTYFDERDFILDCISRAIKTYVVKPKHIVQKSQFDLVTEIDTSIEDFLIKEIKNKYPGDIIHSEETLKNSKIEGRCWIIDPIDGTCNMANGIKLFGLQLVFCDDKVPVLSVINLPHLNELYVAVRGQGVTLNGKKVSVNSDVTLNNAILDFGDFSHSHPEMAVAQYRAFGSLFEKVQKIRMFGSACVTFADVASGKTHSGVILTTNLWDLIPGYLMCKEAGAIVTNAQGQEYHYGDGGIVASCNKEVHKLVIDALNN